MYQSLCRSLDITANNATAAASRNPQSVMSTPPELISFHITGGVYISERLFYFAPSKWNKKQIEYTHQHH